MDLLSKHQGRQDPPGRMTPDPEPGPRHARPSRRLGDRVELYLWLLVVASLITGDATGAQTPEVRSSLSATEIELQVARTPLPYLVLDLASNTMEIRMKGRTLEVVPLQGHRLLRASQLAATRQPLELPALWNVIKRPPSRRKVTAPSTLSSEESPMDTPPTASGEIPSPPDVYDFETHQGWTVEIGRELIEPSRTQLWRQALADGWATRRGRTRSRPDRLVLEMSPESATRLHHLIRPEIPLLILATTAPRDHLDQ